MIEEAISTEKKAVSFAQKLIRVTNSGNLSIARKRSTLLGHLCIGLFVSFSAALLLVIVLYAFGFVSVLGSYRCYVDEVGSGNYCDGWIETLASYGGDTFAEATDVTGSQINDLMDSLVFYAPGPTWADMVPVMAVAMAFLLFTRPVRRLLLGRTVMKSDGEVLKFGRKSYLVKDLSFEPDYILAGGTATGHIMGNSVQLSNITPQRLVKSGRINLRYGDRDPISTLIYAKRDEKFVAAVIARLNEFVTARS